MQIKTKSKCPGATYLEASVSSGNGNFSFIDAAGGDGFHGIGFHVSSENGMLNLSEASSSRLFNGGYSIEGKLAEEIFLSLKIEKAKAVDGWKLKPTILNKSSSAFRINGYGFAAEDGCSGPLIGKAGFEPLLYASTSNLRLEELPFCGSSIQFIRPVPINPISIGGEPCGSIPVIFVGRRNGGRWLAHAALSQERHLLRWDLSLSRAKGRHMEFAAKFFWNGGLPESVPPGGAMELESSLFMLVDSEPDRLYQPYMEEIQEEYGFRLAGGRSLLRHTPVYCTWNFNVFKDIDEDRCVRRMEIASKIQPGGFFQLDDGYQREVIEGQASSTSIDAYYPDPDKAWDLKLFPSGPEGFVNACLGRHLRPAIWFTTRLEKGGPIEKGHPEWILLCKDGSPVTEVGYPMLDVSVTEVREFISECIRTLVRGWGFQGIKLDFFSWMFDYPGACFRNGGTGAYWKRWMFKLIRGELGPEGYFLHCISCPLGNPLLAVDGPDAYRAGIDIHSGEWGYNVRSVSWLLPGMLANNSNTWFGNADSWMGGPDVPKAERRFRLAYAYMTAGMAEFSGPLELLDKEALTDYRRMVARLDAGTGFECPGREPFFGEPYPSILVRRHRRESVTRRLDGISATLALFNWTDTEKPSAVSLKELRLKGRPHDFWTSKPITVRNGMIASMLPPRGHMIADFTD